MSSLRTCLLESPNHKVRIAAAQAIMVWRSRAAYGSSFASVFECFLLAMRHIDDDNDFVTTSTKKGFAHRCVVIDGCCKLCGLCGCVVLVVLVVRVVWLHCVALLGVSQQRESG